MYRSRAQARWFDNAVARARQRDEPVQSLLLLIVKVLLRCVPMSLGRESDARHVAVDDFDALTSRRTAHYLSSRRLLTPERLWDIARDVNVGGFGGRGTARKADAFDMLTNTAADVVFVDAPYLGTACYRREYALIDCRPRRTPRGALPCSQRLRALEQFR